MIKINLLKGMERKKNETLAEYIARNGKVTQLPIALPVDSNFTASPIEEKPTPFYESTVDEGYPTEGVKAEYPTHGVNENEDV